MKNYIKQTIFLLLYICNLLSKGGFCGRYSYKKRYSGSMVILANGPSLKEVLPEIGVKKEFDNVEFTVMNFFAFDSAFLRIRPRFYCLADPMYIRADSRYEEVKKLFLFLQEKVDWDMNLYIPKGFGKKNFLRYSSLTNPYIHIVTVNATIYEGFECWRHWLYKKNLAMPLISTVAQLGIYVAINSGFQNVSLYGVEHNMICSLFVNSENQLCNRMEHFYDHSVVLKPIIKADTNEQFKITDYLTEMGALFRGHDLLANYAKLLDVRVTNCTTVSMIDSYDRI
ncbi:hypothetical protein FNW54_03260 [Bacteroides sp. HF-5092]|uniref:hypothetical protein n=1 Tax=Bacteroides TaxID=816 RepID=UPI00117740C4|nr:MULTISPECIES: hypothetical protein [Bacteroides]TRX46498.1 hypothetical protein FNW54_03260 [Bacteroides sp. HF-5092]